MSAKAVTDAKKLLKTAAGYEKKTWSRWNPDWDRASREYDAAVKVLMKYKRDADCKQLLFQAYSKGAVALKNNKMPLKSAQYSEKAAELAAGNSDWKECFRLYTIAASGHANDLERKSHGQCYRKAGQTLTKAAMTISKGDAKLALQAFKDATEYWQSCSQEDTEEKSTHMQFASDTYDKAVRFCCNSDQCEEAIWFLMKEKAQYMAQFDEFSYTIYRNLLMTTLLRFHLNMYKEAEKAHEKHIATEQFSDSDHGQIEAHLFSALYSASNDAFRQVLMRGAIASLPDHVARIARQLHLSQEIIDAGPRPDKDPNTLEGFLNGGASGDEKDEESDESDYS